MKSRGWFLASPAAAVRLAFLEQADLEAEGVLATLAAAAEAEVPEEELELVEEPDPEPETVKSTQDS